MVPKALVQLTCFALDGSWKHRIEYWTREVVLASGIERPYIPAVKGEVAHMLATDTLPEVKTWGGPVVISYQGEPMALVLPAAS